MREHINLFVSYSSRGRKFWEPLVTHLEKQYDCKIIWNRSENPYPLKHTLFKGMVQKCDIAVFLLTHRATGVLEELKLWKEFHNDDFKNALLLKDKKVRPSWAKKYLGFELPTFLKGSCRGH